MFTRDDWKGMGQSEVRINVEPCTATYSGMLVTVGWTHFGLAWRSCSFTTWAAAIRFLMLNGGDFQFNRIIVHSEFLG